jgi:flagellar biosynthesis/type III secretory pathway chaperone
VNHLERLKTCLTQLISLHRALIDALEIEQDAMSHLDGGLITDCAQTKQSILNDIITSEAERIRIVDSLAKNYSSTGFEKISDLYAHISEQQKQELVVLQSDLQNALEKCRELNQTNMKLASESLARIDTMKRNILGQKNNNAENYNAQGSRNPVTTHGGRLISEQA